MHNVENQKNSNFLEKYKDVIFTAPECQLAELTGYRLWKQIQKRPNKKTGGLDGWRTPEVKDLPVRIVARFAALLRLVESGSPWPAASRECPPAGARGSVGTDSQPLLMSCKRLKIGESQGYLY